MSNALTVLTQKLAERFSLGDGSELISTLKATAFKGEVTDAQMVALMVVANQYGLNPWTKEIYAFPDKKNGIIPVVGVDGWARIINSSDQLDGIEFKYSDAMTTQDGAKSACYEWAECHIYKRGCSKPVVIREYLDECYRPPFKTDKGYIVDGPWQTHPKRFLRHKALIQCARIAFGFVGIYDQDEAERIVEKDMGQAEVVQQPKIDLDVVAWDIDQINSEHELNVFWRKKAAELCYKKGDDNKIMDAITALCTERKNAIKQLLSDSGN